MSSSVRRRVRRVRGSRRTARPGHWRRGSRTGSEPTPITLQPDAASTLADGVVVETRLVARLLGLTLLRVDGLVLLSPARVREPQPAVRAARGSAPSASVAYRNDGVRAGERLALAGRLLASTETRLGAAGTAHPPVTGRFS